MNKGKFEAAKNGLESVLDQLDLLEERHSSPHYPHDMPSIVRPLPYKDMWQLSKMNMWYDYRLTDQSLLQFKREPTLSYVFLESPLIALTFEEFAFREYGQDWDVFAHEIRDEYELYLSSSIEERPATPVRYDYDTSLYREGVHPAGHLHIGIGNQIRLCSPRIMNPTSFCLFIVRQFYPSHWEKLLRIKEREHIFREVRDNLDAVPDKFFKGLDRNELILA